MFFYSEDKNVIEHNMDSSKYLAEENLRKYHETNDREYLDNYYKYRDEYRQYSYMLDK